MTADRLESGGAWRVMRVAGPLTTDPGAWPVVADAVGDAVEGGSPVLLVCASEPHTRVLLQNLLTEVATGALTARPEGVRDVAAQIASWHREFITRCGGRGRWDDRLDETFSGLTRALYGAALLAEVTPTLRARILASAAEATAMAGTTILSTLLADRGLAATWLDASRLLRATEGADAAPPPTESSAVAVAGEALSELARRTRREVLMTQGSVASTESGETVFLEPGGADVSAALLAEGLAAERLELWNETPGFFTADPAIVPSARLLRHVGYEEALELASTTGGVFHPPAIEIVRRWGGEVLVRGVRGPDSEGTRISGSAPDASASVLAVAVRDGVTMVTMHTAGMWHRVGFLAAVFGAFERHGISIDLVSTSETSVSVTLDPGASALESSAGERLLDELRKHCQPTVLESLAAVSLVGRGLRRVLPELVPALHVLGGQSVHLLSQAASDVNLSVVVDSDQAERMVRELHAAFFGAVEEGEVFGPTYVQASAGAQPHGTADRWWALRREELLHLAEEGTPMYVYDLDTVRAAARTLRSVASVSRVMYSVKANPHPEILAALRDEALGFECVSIGEVEHVRRHVAGLEPADVLFTPNFAPREEYRLALEVGATVTVDNLYVVEKWPETFAGRDIFLRVDPGHGRGHSAHVRTAGSASKFGLAVGDLARARRAVQAAGARVVGLHAHLGSGITDPLAWAETASFLVSLIEVFPDVRVLDLGGGLAAPSPDGVGFDVDTAAGHLSAFKDLHPEVDLWLEPGRFLVAEGGALLTRATQRKRKGGLLFVGVDAGMNTLLRPALYGAYHEIVNLTRLGRPPEITAEVVGPICETGDVLGHARRLPPTEEGDVLLIATAGAYGRVMASTYNERPLPREVVLKGVRRSVERRPA